MPTYYDRQGGEALANSSIAGNQDGAEIAYLADGRFVIVWRDYSASGGDTSGSAIRGRIFNADGTTAGAEFLVNTSTTGYQQLPGLIALPSGGFVVTWGDATLDSSDSNIRAQVFGADGLKSGGEILVNTHLAGYQTSPSGAALAGGGFVLTWTDQSAEPSVAGTGGSPIGVRQQLFDASGVPVGGEAAVNTSTTYEQSHPAVAALAGGGYVIVWEDRGTKNGIVGQLYGADGTKIGSEFLVSTIVSGTQYDASVASLTGGGFVVTWTDDSQIGGDTHYNGIKAQIYDSAGARIGGEFLVNTDTGNHQNFSLVKGLPNGGFAVTWSSTSLNDGDPDVSAVKAQLFDSSGARDGAEFLVNVVTAKDQFGTGLAASGDTLTFVWADLSGLGGDTSGSGVKFSRYVLSQGSEGADTLTGTAAEDMLHGFGGGDVLSGGGAADQLFGGDGADILSGGDGDDIVNGDAGNDGLDGGLGNDRIDGGDGDDVLIGGLGNDVLGGGGGNDSLDGGDGDDSFYYTATGTVDLDSAAGGAGIDRLYVDFTHFAAAEGVIMTIAADSSGGYQGGIASGADRRIDFSGIEAFNIAATDLADQVTTGSADDVILAFGGDDVVDAGAGNDYIYGGSGNDVMTGGLGNDTFDVGDAGDVVIEGEAGGTDEVQTSLAAYTLGVNVEILAGISMLGQQLTGNALDNMIYGNGGADLLDGGAGADTLSGGGGNDIYVVDTLADIISDSSGVDEIRTALSSYSLATRYSIENLTGTADSGQTLTGNDLANTLRGGAGADILAGGIGNDQLFGGAGNDRLDGGVGIDTMAGGQGDDVYTIDVDTDVVVEAAGEGIDEVLVSGTSYTLPDNVENATAVGEHWHNIYGNALDNILKGTDQFDSLNGGAGADTMIGGGGDDLYYVDSVDDVIVEWTGKFDYSGDTVTTTLLDFTLRADLENLVGSTAHQRLVGNDSDNSLSSVGGADTMIGGKGNDSYSAHDGDVIVELEGEGVDTIYTDAASYVLPDWVENLDGGRSGNQVLTGNALDNRIDGSTYNDTLDGGAGADAMAGGTGNDIYFVDNAGDVVSESTNQGTDEVRTSLASYTLGANLEKLTGTSAAGQVLTGNTLANTVTGGAGADVLLGNGGADRLEGGDDNDSLDGGLGDDILIGGAGADLILGGDGADKIVYLAVSDSLDGAMDHILHFASGTDKIDLTALVISSLSWSELIDAADSTLYSLVSLISFGTNMSIRVDAHLVQADFLVGQFVGPTEGADTLNGTSGPDLINGLGGNDVINGLAGNDVIDGGLGLDRMTGGAGDDLYYVDSIGDTVVEQAGEGNDEIRTAISFYTLPGNVEKLTATSNAGQSLTGNGSVNLITGGGGNDTLDGGLGADTMYGGTGDDVYRTDEAGDVAVELAGEGTDQVWTVSASYTLGANVENLTGLSNTGQALTGNDGVNIILGGAGNDVIDGGLGSDDLHGGAGNDLYLVDDAGDMVVEFNGEGSDEVRTALTSFTLGSNLENLTGTANSGQTLNGNGLANIIAGGGGNDILDGGAGADRLAGGAGNDIYYLDDAGDSTVELPDQGIDEIRTGLAGVALGNFANVENLTGTSNAGQILYGNALANLIMAGAGNDSIDGAAGADTMIGGLGDDYYNVDVAGDTIVELAGEGYDRVRSTASSYALSANLETLIGVSSGGQILTGNALDNLIVGGSGNDQIDGGAGGDGMSGGLGDDIFYADSDSDSIDEAPGGGRDEIRTALASYSILWLANVENLTGTGTDDQSLTGNSGDNVIDGGAGADTMTGGLGNDSYVVDTIGDVVVELAGEGTDEIRTAMSVYSIAGSANVENLTATSNINHDLRGNGGNNLVTGAGGNDFIRLQDGGIDSVQGGGGNDVILFGASLNAADLVDGGAGTDQVAIQGDYSGGLTLGASFTSIESFAILPGSDARFGDTAGNFYDYNLTTVEANVAAGVLMVVDANRLRAGEDFTFNGSAETDGNFFLYGGGGTDTLLGGSKNDTFYFGENGQFGATDHVDGGVSGIDQLGLRGSYTIAFGANQLTSIESIGLVSAQDTRFGALGSSYNYNLTMNDGNLAAGVRMTVDAAPLRGTETLTFDGSAETDGWFRIFGGQGSDTITGSQTADIISGGLGSDNLRGAGGADTFLYRSVADSLLSARDSILDFSSGDRIDLSQIDAVSGTPANDAFTFIGSAAFSGAAGELRASFYAGNGLWTVSGDVNGDGIADIEFYVTSDHPIVGGDFAL